MSKFYTRSSKAATASNNDPRIITPTSIPIFILPPTLDHNNNNGGVRKHNDGNENIFNI
jgi:hypothetical protein